MTKVTLKKFAAAGIMLAIGAPGFASQTVQTVYMADNSYAAGLSATNFVSMDQQNRSGGWWVQFDDNDGRDWLTRYTESSRSVVRSTLSLQQDVGNHQIHWGVAEAPDQRLNQFGVSIGKTSLFGFSGNGDTVSTLFQPNAAVDSFHFHGGLRQKYEYAGYRIGYQFNNNQSAGFTYARIEADGLDDRMVNEFSWQGKRLDLSLTQVNVGEQVAGNAFSFGSRVGKTHLSFQHMKADNDASYNSFLISSRTRRGKTVSMRLEQRHNPLFDLNNDNRITFNLGFQLKGGSLAMHATETEVTEEGSEAVVKKSKATPVLVAAGAVGAAVALSSGSSSNDASPRFASQNQSAQEVLNRINPSSVAQNREFGGYVYRNVDGSFSSTAPIRGEFASVALPDPATAAPNGATTTASYHTHAAFDPNFDNENFSPQDLLSDLLFRLDGYLATPAGQFKFHNFRTNRVVTLGGPGSLATN